MFLNIASKMYRFPPGFQAERSPPQNMNITRTRNVVLTWLALRALVLATSAQAQTIDTISFGDSNSEAAHGFTAPLSATFTGGLGQSARQLLPKTPNDVYGGDMTFQMTVDPVKQNFLSAKFWGSDTNSNAVLILNCNGREIGSRHGGDSLGDDELYFTSGNWYANRFFYRTCPLPISMTHGKTSVTITIRSVGTTYNYAPIFTYVPQYQHLMSMSSPGIYRAYTHVGSVVDVSAEAQGTAPATVTPRTLENETTALANVESSVNSRLASDLAVSGSSLSETDASFLASVYDAQTNAGASWITYPTGKTSADVGRQIVASLDALVASYALNPSVAASNWGGNLAPMGDAIRLSWPLISGSMSGTVAFGGSLGTTTRQGGWSAALRASVDFGRYNRRTIANQDITCGENIYRANRGLLLVNSANALYESEAVRYFKEASGILPWLGNDLASGGTDGLGGGPVPTQNTAPPYGPNWYMCTTKGTTKDGDGFVGSDYGELGTRIYNVGTLSGDAQIQARGLVMARARCQFRYPSVDGDGYFIMMGTDPIGDRNSSEFHYDYLGSGNSDDFQMASAGAAAIGNDLLGYFQEAMNDGQMVRNFYNLNPYLPGQWAAIKAMAQTNVQLPQAPGAADFAWVDEENMVVSAKHGEERFFANLYWRSPGFINGIAKVYRTTPGMANLADVVMDDLRFRGSGQSLLVGGNVDGFATMEDNPVGAYDGWPELIALRSDLSSIPPTNRDGGRGTGYTLRYGNWLVGINADYSANYTMQLPGDFASSKDFISGQVMSGPVVLGPKTSVVFYLPNVTSPSVPPSRTLYTAAIPGNGRVSVGWTYAGGATSYNVGRSTTSGGPYTTIASGVTGNSYIDTAVTAGTAYYYVITSVGSTGTSGYSPEASATPVVPETSGLPTAWMDADIGTSTGGSATVAGSTYTLKSGGGDLWSTADGCHFQYQVLFGDGVLTARVQSQSSTSSGAKTGLMMRDSLAANAERLSICMKPSGSAESDWRGGDGGSTVGWSLGGLTIPYWVRLVRSGSTLSDYVSQDGISWVQVATYTDKTNMPYALYAGLVTTPANGNAGQNSTGVFTNVTFPAGATAAPATPSGLVGSAGVASASLSWTSVDGAGSYTISRGLSASGPFTPVATGVGALNFTDSGLTNGTAYYYVITAVNDAGTSANSAAVNVTPGIPPAAALTGLAATSGSGQAVLTWMAVPGATGYTVRRSTQLWSNSKPVIASGVSAVTYTDTGLTNGTTYIYWVSASLNGVEGVPARVDVTPPGLPSPWQTQDIGGSMDTTLAGASSADGATYTVTGGGTSGNGIGGTADQFRFVYRPVTGDCDFAARVATMPTVASGAAAAAPAGIMIRNSLDASSSYAMTAVTAGNGVIFSRRNGTGTSGGTTSTQGGLAAPYWVRIKRTGLYVSSFFSADGVNWTPNGSAQTVPLNSVCYVGLAVSSNSNTSSITATFDNLALSAMTNVATGGTASAYAGTASQAFDGNINTKWYSTVLTGTGTLQYQFAAGTSWPVNQYVITSGNDVPQRDPAGWQFQGSNDGTNWNTLDTQSGQVFPSRTQSRSYSIPNTTTYSYYRLYFTANAGGSGYGLQLSELALYTLNTVQGSVAPAFLTAAASNGSVALSWMAIPGATSYNVLRSTTLGGTYTTVGSTTGTNYSDGTAANGTTYYYQVVSVGSGGQSPTSVTATAMPIAAPAAPAALAASAGNAVVSLSWTASSSAGTYNVKRATTSGGPYTTIDNVSGTFCTDSSPTNGTTYYYVVSAVNIGGESGNSTEASATPLAPPAAPAGLTATPGNATVSLAWSSSPTAASYNLKRATTSGGPYTPLASQTGLSYTDNAVTNGTTYYYVVSAVNIGGEGANSGESSARPLPPLPAAPGGFSAAGATGQVSLSWNSSTYATGYSIGRSGTSGGPYAVLATPGGTSYVDTGVASGSTYYYVIAGVDMTGTGAPSAEVSVTLAPGAVTGLTALANSDQVTLTWGSVPGAASYTVGRSTTNGGPYTPVASNLSATTYTDAGLTDGITYYYVLTAVNAGGSSSNSLQVSATPMAQNLYWDTTTAAGLGNGNGNWDINTTQTWSLTSAGASNPLLAFFQDDSAYFQTAGTLTATIATGVTIKVGSINQAVNNTVTTISGGALQIDGTNGGITNAVGGGNKALTINSALILNSPNVTIDNETTGGAVYLNGVISETGGGRALVKTGVGALQFGSAANTFSRGVVISSTAQVGFYNSASFGTGTITFNAGTSLSSAAQIYTNSGGGAGTLPNNIAVTAGCFGTYNGDHSMVFSGNLLGTGSGSGTFYLNTGTHASNVTLSGDNRAFDGTLAYYDNGSTTLYLSSTNAGGANAVWTFTGGATKGLGANFTGSNTFLFGEIASASGSGRLFNNQSSGTATLQIGDNSLNSPSYGGVITNGAAGGKIAISKVGTDTQILTGSNSYTGATIVNGGALWINGSIASGSTVTVNSGGSLGGNGAIGGAVVVASGGILAPGNSAAGTLTFAGGLNLNGGAVLNLGLGGSSDLVALTAGGYVAPGSGTVTINLNALTGFGPGIYNLVTGANGISASSFVLGACPPNCVCQLSASNGTLSVTVSPTAPAGLVAQGYDTQADLYWSPAAYATGYTVKRSTTSGGSYTPVATGVTNTYYTDTGLANGTVYYYVVTATNGAVESAISNEASATPTAHSGFDAWSSTDVGTVGLSGSGSYSAGTYTVSGAGIGVWGTADGFQFVYQAMTGDGAVIARLASQTSGKSGLMMRNTLDANSEYADMNIQLGFNAKFECRTATGGNATNPGQGTASAPYWLKLARVGNVFTGSISSDGVNWTQVGQATIPMSATIEVGLDETSQSTTTLGTMTLDNVAIVPSALWATQDVGSPSIAGFTSYSNSILTVNASGADVSGTSDQFRYAYKAVSGDCDITCRITNVENTSLLAKAGVMIRETLGAAASNIFVAATPGNGVVFQSRASTGGATSSLGASALPVPCWVRITRSGNSFTALASPDGTAGSWITLGSQNIPMATSVYIGVGTTSHNNSTEGTAAFDNMTIDP